MKFKAQTSSSTLGWKRRPVLVARRPRLGRPVDTVLALYVKIYEVLQAVFVIISTKATNFLFLYFIFLNVQYKQAAQIHVKIRK